MSKPIDPILDQLRNQIVEASAADIERVIGEARRDALAEFKALLKTHLFNAVFEVAQNLPLTPQAAASGDGLPAPEDVATDQTPTLETPAPRPVFDDDAPAPDDPDPAPMAKAEPAEEAPTAEPDSVFEPVQRHDLLLEGEDEVDPEILQEIESIRQQISKNEQLLSQLKPFFRTNEGGHA